MSHSCAQWRGDIGAYVIGALDSCASDRVTRHLAVCAGCRADYDELLPVRDLLGLAARTAGLPEPDLAELSEPPGRPAGKSRGGRLRTGRWLAPGVAALAAAATVAALLVASAGSARTFRAADSATGVTGRALLHGTPTGTQIDLTASGLPGHERCILVAVTRGSTDIAGSWDATYDGSARIAGTTEFPASQLIALRIESDTGNLLLSIRV